MCFCFFWLGLPTLSITLRFCIDLAHFNYISKVGNQLALKGLSATNRVGFLLCFYTQMSELIFWAVYNQQNVLTLNNCGLWLLLLQLTADVDLVQVEFIAFVLRESLLKPLEAKCLT